MLSRAIPSFFTVGNLFMGIIAIILAFEGKTEYAAILIIISMFLDGLDGRVARYLNVQSDFGKELDSLSDVISFGVAPALIMYVAVLQYYGAIGLIITALFPIAGALRLARFNVKPGIPGYFVGLPITAAGGVLATISLYYEIFPEAVLLLTIILLSYLMVSNIKYPNFKKVGYPKAILWITPLIIILVVILAIIFPAEFPRIVFLPLGFYALYGLRSGVSRKRKSVDEELNSETNES